MQPSDRIARRIRLHDLHVLMTVVQAGSMNKAAKLLNTTQPAVSKTIAELEHTVGVRLLDRHRQGVEPTRYGRVLLDGGVAVFDDLRQTLQNIAFLDDPAAGNIRIGCSPSLAASFVSAVIDRVSRLFPRVTFELVPAPGEIVLPDLHERKLDLLITRKLGPIPDEKLSFEFLLDDPLLVVAGRRHPLTRRRKVTMDQLVGASWLLPPSDNLMGSAIQESVRANGVDLPRATVVTVSTDARMRLLATGRFVAVLPASALQFSAKQSDVVALPVAMSMAAVPVGIITLKTRRLSPVAQLFIDEAREVAKPLAKKKR